MLGFDEVGVNGLDTAERLRLFKNVIDSGENGGGACAGRGDDGARPASALFPRGRRGAGGQLGDPCMASGCTCICPGRAGMLLAPPVLALLLNEREHGESGALDAADTRPGMPDGAGRRLLAGCPADALSLVAHARSGSVARDW